MALFLPLVAQGTLLSHCFTNSGLRETKPAAKHALQEAVCWLVLTFTCELQLLTKTPQRSKGEVKYYFVRCPVGVDALWKYLLPTVSRIGLPPPGRPK